MFKATWSFLFLSLSEPPQPFGTYLNLSKPIQTYPKPILNLSKPFCTYLKFMYGGLNELHLWLHHIEMPTGRQIIKETFGKRWKYDLVGMEKNIKHWDS